MKPLKVKKSNLIPPSHTKIATTERQTPSQVSTKIPKGRGKNPTHRIHEDVGLADLAADDVRNVFLESTTKNASVIVCQEVACAPRVRDVDLLVGRDGDEDEIRTEVEEKEMGRDRNA